MGAFETGYTAFHGHDFICRGTLVEVISATKERIDEGVPDRIAIFKNDTARVLDFDFRGTLDEVLERLEQHPLVETPQESPRPRKGPVLRAAESGQ